MLFAASTSLVVGGVLLPTGAIVCVDGKPLPKGDDSVTVPQGSQLCLGVDTPEQCAARQKPVVQSPTGSSTLQLAV
ncbi:hypothetical protein [Streptomyces sp. NPDC088762]|uniref:hypothetical protein n=1 Tax=Streptomyces sp. NPDC088762 TaxID=3365891 RepID=UPI003811BD66